ncbi:hypothetical protein B0H10DRAFT_2429114 [Mycena sp. CBHHK59/15]|nr:hypothetical protein B0H10DRAFT_2429114 [Mycena sp. CBHHK59/15]
MWFTLAVILTYIPLISVVDARLNTAPQTRHVGKRDALSDSGLQSASWIWASGSTSGNAAFLKTFSSASGKTAFAATISMSAVNQFTLWVNGQPIGASGDGADDWKSAQVLNAALNTSTNLFSVLALNNANSGAPAAGLLAAIHIKYTDGSGDTVVSDSSWAASSNIPSDFPTPSDTSHFASAAVAAPYGSGSWGQSQYMDLVDTECCGCPPETVGFRKTVATPSGKTAISATVVLTADNSFALYLNGKYVGAPPHDPNTSGEIAGWQIGQQFTVGLNAASNVFTAFAQNFPAQGTNDGTSSAGLIAVVRYSYSDGSSDIVGTDATWLSGAFTSVSAFLSTPDSALTPSFVLGNYGMSPWGQLTAISNALNAANVPAYPFTSSTPTSSSASSGASSIGGADTIGTAASASHSISKPALVGGVVGGLAIILAAAAFFWRRKHRNAKLPYSTTQHHSRTSSNPFATEGSQAADFSSPSVSASSMSSPTSMSSLSILRKPEMANSQWPPRTASDLQPQRRARELNPVPMASNLYPQPMASNPQPPPLTKIEREYRMRLRSIGASSPNSVALGGSNPTPSQGHSRNPSEARSRVQAEAEGVNNDTETLAPPSYYEE